MSFKSLYADQDGEKKNLWHNREDENIYESLCLSTGLVRLWISYSYFNLNLSEYLEVILLIFFELKLSLTQKWIYGSYFVQKFSVQHWNFCEIFWYFYQF